MILFKKIFFMLAFGFLATTVYAEEQLIIEPDMGREPLLKAIDQAHSSVDLVIYGMTDQAFIKALADAKRKGTAVRVMVEPKPYLNEDENIQSIANLTSQQITYHEPNPAFHLTHQKTFIFDNTSALVMTLNLTQSAFKEQRNFALLITDKDMVKEIADVFQSDWQQQPITKVHNKNLVWGPENSREKLTDLIHQAKSSIKVYAQDITDYQVKGDLAEAARNGIDVQVLLPPGKQGDPRMDYLKNNGVKFHYSHYNIHAKAMIIDHKKVLLGSMNFSKSAIQHNRELSIITDESQVVSLLEKTFDHDWDHGTSVATRSALMPHLPSLLRWHL